MRVSVRRLRSAAGRRSLTHWSPRELHGRVGLHAAMQRFGSPATAAATSASMTPPLNHADNQRQPQSQSQSQPPSTNIKWDWRRALVSRVVASHRGIRLQVTSKSLYLTLDALSEPVLRFFYHDMDLPATFQSWFMVTQLHVWMVQTRLRSEGADGKIMHASLLDHFTTDLELKMTASGLDNVVLFERNLHTLLSTHYGCVLAYDEGLETGDCVLASALWRNLYGMKQDVSAGQLLAMVHYVRSQLVHVHSLPFQQLLQGHVHLRDPVANQPVWSDLAQGAMAVQ